MSASIRIRVMGGTDIETAYFDCEDVSASLGGISVETSFNGVEMFYYCQPLDVWKDEYKKAVYGLSNDRSAKKGRRRGMRKNMPYMVLDITKKPGDPNAVKTGDMLLAENTKLREAISTLRTALKEIRNDVLDMVMNHKSEDPDSYAHGFCLSIGGACDMALNSTKEFEGGGAE